MRYFGDVHISPPRHDANDRVTDFYASNDTILSTIPIFNEVFPSQLVSDNLTATPLLQYLISNRRIGPEAKSHGFQSLAAAQ